MHLPCNYERFHSLRKVQAAGRSQIDFDLHFSLFFLGIGHELYRRPNGNCKVRPLVAGDYRIPGLYGANFFAAEGASVLSTIRIWPGGDGTA